MVIKVDENIELRQMEISDSGEIFRLIDSQREYLGRWLPFVEYTKGVSDTEKFVESIVNASDDRFELVFTIRKSGEFIGLIGFKDTDRINKKSEIGYWLSEREQRQGIITKSVSALCQYAFGKLDINRIQIKCAAGNIASKNVPKRLGFLLEGVEREGELLTGNVFTDLEIYSKLRSDLNNR